MVNEEVITFIYCAIVADYQRYMGEVENNNALRHDGGTKSQIGFYSAWGTPW